MEEMDCLSRKTNVQLKPGMIKTNHKPKTAFIILLKGNQKRPNNMIITSADIFFAR